MPSNRAKSTAKPLHTPSGVVFTLASAEHALVLVRRIVADIVTRQRAIQALKQRRDGLTATLDDAGAQDEVRAELTQALRELNRLHQELVDIGCVLRDWKTGQVDFPSVFEGRRVYLCWRAGEAGITHWHEEDDGNCDRKRIDERFRADPAQG